MALHEIAQLPAHDSSASPALWQALDAEQFETFAPAGHAQEIALEEQFWLTALIWLLQPLSRQLEHAEDGLMPIEGQLVAE